MKTHLALSMGVALLVTAPLAQAQTAPAPGEMGGEAHRGGGRRGFDAIDTNHDGVVTLDEWKAAGRREERFNAIDVNHTGRITRDDMRAYMQKMREQHRHDGSGWHDGGGQNTGGQNTGAHDAPGEHDAH